MMRLLDGFPVLRIDQIGEFGLQRLLPADVEETLTHSGVFQNMTGGIDNDHCVRTLVQNQVCHGFRLRRQIGDAHLQLRFPEKDGNGLLAAACIAAGAAIKFIFRTVLSGLREDLPDFFFRRHGLIKGAVFELLIETDALHPSPELLLRSGIGSDCILHIQLDLVGVNSVPADGRALDTAVFTAVHFDHAAVDRAGFDIPAELNTVGETMDSKLTVVA